MNTTSVFTFCLAAALICSATARFPFADDSGAASAESTDDLFAPSRLQLRMQQQFAKRQQHSKVGNVQHIAEHEGLENGEALMRALAAIQRDADEEQAYLFDSSEGADYEDQRDNSNAEQREDEVASHGSLAGAHQFQYVSGGTGEGKQVIGPDNDMENKEEVKSDEDLPTYCDPPNPCPVGYVGEDCDSSKPFEEYTAEYSKTYQEQQNCMCDDDHNECAKSRRAKSNDKQPNTKYNSSPVVAKKSPRMRRDLSDANEENKTQHRQHRLRQNRYFNGKALKMHVAKKSI